MRIIADETAKATVQTKDEAIDEKQDNINKTYNISKAIEYIKSKDSKALAQSTINLLSAD